MAFVSFYVLKASADLSSSLEIFSLSIYFNILERIFGYLNQTKII
jgi:hypothetical protein